MEKKKPDIKIDKLKYAYFEAKDRMLSEKDAVMINMTNVFLETLKDKINHRELIVIAVRGEVRTGKSTVVLAVMKYINDYIKHIKLNNDPSENPSKYIFADQTEFLRFINGDERNAMLAIDEFNSMASTGLNATTEEALFDYYSDVFAGQYLHRIFASPDIITDKNATMILDVIGKDENQGIVRCKLVYRDIITKIQVTIGHVDINVQTIIKEWINSNVRELVEKKGNLNKEEKEYVNKKKEQDFYVKYQIKKYDRMNLLKEHGVRDIRDLEYASIVIEVLNELQDYAKVKKPSKELIDTIVDEVCKRNKRIYSMLTVNEISQRARAVLNIFYEINNLWKKLESKTITPTEEIIIKRTIEQAKELLNKRIEQQQKWSTIYKEYMNIK